MRDMSRSVIVFDGECGLCNGFVAWLIVRDRRGAFAVTGSAGELGAAALAAGGVHEAMAQSTIVVVKPGGKALTHSTAVLRILSALPLPWSLARVGFAVPRGLRDRVYRAFAKRRSRVSADDAACGVPPAHLVDLWHTRLATAADIDALRGARETSDPAPSG